MPRVEFVGDGCDGDALAGVAEYLRTGDHQDVVVRVPGHGGLVGRIERASQGFAEVHAKVGEVFDDDGVVSGSQLADRTQLILGEAYPRRIVGVRIDDGGDVALCEVAFQLWAQFFGAVFIDVERCAGDIEDLHLVALHGESGVDEEDRILPGRELRAEQESRETALHRPDCRDAALRCDPDVEERADETRSLLFEFGDAEHVGVLRRHARLQGPAFGFDPRLFGRKPRHAHFEVQEFHPRLRFHDAGYVARLADRRLGDVRNVHALQRGVEHGAVYRQPSHCAVCFCAYA